MAQEIERKFLVSGDFKAEAISSVSITQGYLCSDPERNVRIRTKGNKAFITIKGATHDNGTSRFEWEQEIPFYDALDLLQLCEPGIIEKTRYLIPIDDHVFEVDEFHGLNEGLVLAEIELDNISEKFKKPDWLGKEVTGDIRYYNASLLKSPFTNW